MIIRAVLVVALSLGVVRASPSWAQSGQEPNQQTPVSPSPSATDLQALNFYLQQNDQASADAELRRLRGKFPAWSPPEDLSDLALTDPSTEIDTIYRQIADGQLAEARATIAATQAEYPQWTVPNDMERLLGTAEGQVRLDVALDAGNAAEALEIASSVDGLLRCDRVNNAWRIAEAQQRQSAVAAALGTYRAIIGACTEIAVISATLEKSEPVTTESELVALFDTARSRFPGEAADLDDLQARLLAGRGVGPATIAIAPDAKVRPRKRPVQTEEASAPPPATVERQAPTDEPAAVAPAQGISGCLAATNGTTSPSRLMERGWCAYNLERPMEALAAFGNAEARLSGAQRRDARFGMALSYLKLNMTEEASRLAATTDLTRQQRIDTESIILNQRGVVAYQQGRYRKAIGYFDALEQVSGRLRRDLALLRGYAYLNSGNRTRAQEIFLDLHNQLATTESRRAMEAAAED
jgi:tetratricopeptide (TPR) repeat protein